MNSVDENNEGVHGKASAKILTSAEILGKVSLKTRTVFVGGWGGSVILRELNGKQRDKIECELARGRERGNDYSNVRALTLSMSIVDQQGNRLFTSRDDISALNRLSGQILQDLWEEVLDLSGMSVEAEEELEGNLLDLGESNGSD